MQFVVCDETDEAPVARELSSQQLCCEEGQRRTIDFRWILGLVFPSQGDGGAGLSHIASILVP
jgi:hypothetical protein